MPHRLKLGPRPSSPSRLAAGKTKLAWRPSDVPQPVRLGPQRSRAEPQLATPTRPNLYSTISMPHPTFPPGKTVARVLAGAWRDTPSSVDFTAAELEQVAPLLLASGT